MKRWLVVIVAGLTSCNPKSGGDLRQTMTTYTAGPYDAAKILDVPESSVPRLLGFSSEAQLEADLHFFDLLWARCVSAAPVISGALSFRDEAAKTSFTQNLDAELQGRFNLPPCEEDSELPLQVQVTVRRAAAEEPFTLQLSAHVDTELLLPAGPSRVPYVALYSATDITDLLSEALDDFLAEYQLVKGNTE